MKSYLSRILICLVPVLVGIYVCAWATLRDKFRLGVDLVGGTILIYEVDTSKQQGEVQPDELAAALKRRIDPADLYNVTIRPIKSDPPRVEIILPTGGYASGRQTLSEEEVTNIQNLIQQQGRLEFRILANPIDDKEALDQADKYLRNPDNQERLAELEKKGLPPPDPLPQGGGTTFAVTLGGETINYGYSWVLLGKEELYNLKLQNASETSQIPAVTFSWKKVADARDKEAIRFPLNGGSQFLLYSRTISPESLNSRISAKDRKELGKKYEYFVLTRNAEQGKQITGDYLAQVAGGGNERGEPAVHFSFNTDGANLFYELTSLNKPSRAEGSFERKLAILLDGQIRAAPGLRNAIRDRGEISGGFAQKDVQELVTILRAGALPATLKREPVSKNSMGSTLGADTILYGTLSVGLAFLAVLVFMLFYYRFAGIVACIALLANLVLTVAFMVLVNATFTLPGLAGLVLMLGMAVDANVLIYERLREERERGASLALAIRNGYDRAFPTIIDTHLSSIFTAIVLYVVGNDQLKGFGISLTVGLIISLFTSLYMTRLMFDYCLSKGWLHKLSFYQGLVKLLHSHHWDFMGIRYYWFTATLVLTVLGASLFLYRLNPDEKGRSVMAIDFVGGTAYTGKLDEPMTIEELHEKLGKNVPVSGMTLEESDLPGISVEQVFAFGDSGGRSSFFTVRTTVKDARKVQKIINTRLGNALAKIKLDEYTIAPDGKSALLKFTNPKTGQPDFASPAQVKMLLNEEKDIVLPEEKQLSFQDPELPNKSDESEEKKGRYSQMRISPTQKLTREQFEKILAQTKEAFDNSPQPERLENFDAQLAANTQERALYAILASWAAILLYLWFRFGNWTFGTAAVLCLLHDLVFTLGLIAGAHYLHGTWLGNILGISDFKIDLPAIAALLTLVGYSVNDTIVVFDRIREVRGKNPLLTPEMINDSVNQTLTRTILSSMTVWLVVIVLYAFGGEGVHLFAFVMIVGVIVGTYSSIYIASPLLLMFGEGTASSRERARTQQTAAVAET